MRPEIVTERLSLRRGAPQDFDAIHAVYSRPEVARMVGSWPVPADPVRTMRVCAPVPVDQGIAGPILLDGQIIGNMGCLVTDDGQSFSLGYGLHPDHWGRGYASEMARALIAAIFARYPQAARIVAGVWADNPGSARVLQKLGLHRTHIGVGWCTGRAEVMEAHMHEISRADWVAANSPMIQTDRLEIRPYRAGDVAALHHIVSLPQVARMVMAFSGDESLEHVANWVVARRYRGMAGFCLGVYLKGGPLIGNVGLAPGGASTMFFYDPAHWGQGYATEAHRGFLGWAFDRFGFDHIDADHFSDNHASGAVLRKLGFVETGQGMGHSKARLEPAPVIEYRLWRDAFEGRI